MHLFAYGTLMFPEVWRRVVGREFDARPATVTGYAVFRVRGGVFPVMVADDGGGSIAGIVYFDLDHEAFRVLDAYESQFYDRVAIEAETSAGDVVAAQAYVVPPDRRQVVSNRTWDAQEFAQLDLVNYLRDLD